MKVVVSPFFQSRVRIRPER
uniref:Uncharacterized protein n=1 Tax=Lepeophtheirus salmonis TaxID=72036 RepID=A0A0K2U9E9_LEPSM